MSLTFVQGDTAPDLNATLVVEGTTTPIDLTGATVKFQMRKPDDKRYTVNAAASILSPSAGTVRYQWANNDLGVTGDYDSQWEVTFSSGRIQTTAEPVTITVRRQ